MKRKVLSKSDKLNKVSAMLQGRLHGQILVVDYLHQCCRTDFMDRYLSWTTYINVAGPSSRTDTCRELPTSNVLYIYIASAFYGYT